MINSPSTLRKRFFRHGVSTQHAGPEKRQRILLNVFWLIAFVAYQFYFVVVWNLVNNQRPHLIQSAVCLLLAFGFIQLLVHYGFHRAAKFGLLLSIYTGIFFYDTFLGHAAGVHLYYVPFLFVAIYLFSRQTETWQLALMTGLPFAFYWFTETYGHQWFPGMPGEEGTHPLYVVNFMLSMVLVGVCNYIASNINHNNESHLDQSKINLQTLIDNTEGSIWSIGTDYRVIAANRVYRSDMLTIFGIKVYTGYNMLPIVQHPNYPTEWLPHYDRVFGGESFVEEYLHGALTYELQATPIYNVAGEVCGAAFYARNVTARKESERELRLAKERAEAASRAKAQFLSNMSHELRTPLNGIIGLSNILLSEKYLPSQQQFLETLHSSADHMKYIVDDILDYNKIDAGKLVLEHTPFNLYHLLDKLRFVFATQAGDKNIKFRLEASEDLRRNVMGDVTRLQQVLNNLLSNAVKFTDKGEVVLSVQIKNRISEDECLLEYAVRDTGIGIPVEKLQTVFESFSQADAATNRKYGGTGLGLTISRKLVEMMGGELAVESKPGEGSRFAFLLRTQCHHRQVSSSTQKTIQSYASFNGLKVLLAEDNHVNMTIARNMLRKWDIEVTTAVNGALAVNEAKAQVFDLILMDLEMPVMDGWQAVRLIREFRPGVPVLAFTAASYEGLETELLEKGIDGFVHKPFRLAELHGKIAAYATGQSKDGTAIRH